MLDRERGYAYFDLLIERAGRSYKARLLDSPAGTAEERIRFPFSQAELEELLGNLGPVRGVSPLSTSGGRTQPEAARELGSRLFQATITGEVLTRFRTSQALARERREALCLRLSFGADPKLARLPWEHLYDPQERSFLALAVESTVIRLPQLARVPGRHRVRAPIRILVVMASPADHPPLSMQREWNQMQEALSPLLIEERVVLERLDRATTEVLIDRCQAGGFHILHFIGHGELDATGQDSVLYLEGESGATERITGQRLAVLLGDLATGLKLKGGIPLRLVVLNACEAARPAGTELLDGVAQRLVQRGIPAVVAMQFPISDHAAVLFSRYFYRSLADGLPVEAALTEARKAIFIENQGVEWGTPVLYVTAPGERLFETAELAPEGAGGGMPASQGRLKAPLGTQGGSSPTTGEGGFSPSAQTPGPAPAVDGTDAMAAPLHRAQGSGEAESSRWVARLMLLVLLIGLLAVLVGLGLAWRERLTARRATLARTLGLSGLLPPGSVPSSAERPRVPLASAGCPPLDDLGIDFLRVEPGTFRMGSDGGPDSERPPHLVTITRPFCLGATEVTIGQWRRVMGDPATPGAASADDSLPKTNVTWEEVQEFLRRLNSRPEGKVYRLPTEAEWEYTARAGTATRFSFGDAEEDLFQFGNCRSTERNDGYDKAAPVASFRPNAWGLFDVHGNVWEWVADAYGGYSAEPAADPTGPAEGEERVRRGGAFDSAPDNCRSARREASPPGYRRQNLGFRLARNVAALDSL